MTDMAIEQPAGIAASGQLGPELVVQARGGVLQAWLVAFPVLLVVFMPRPPFAVAQALAFPLVGVVVFLLLLVLAQRAGWRLGARCLAVGIGLIGLAAIAAVSELANAGHVRFAAVLTPFKPALHLLMLLVGCVIADRVPPSAVRGGLLRAAMVILAGQLLVVVAQLADVTAIDLVYSEEKARGIGSLLRNTGTLANPNTLGMVLILAVLMFLASGVRRGRGPFVLVTLLLVVFTGSRTMLVILPAALVFHLVVLRLLEREQRGLSTLAIGLLGLALLGGALLAVWLFRDFFPYQAQLLQVLVTGDLSSVNSMALRFAHWDASWTRFLNEPEPLKWWFGLGSRPEFRVADNDWFYTFWRTGAIGLLVQVGVYLVTLLQLNRTPSVNLRTLVISVFLVLASVSWQFETFGSWLYPMLFFYLLGLAFGFWRPTTSSPPGASGGNCA